MRLAGEHQPFAFSEVRDEKEPSWLGDEAQMKKQTSHISQARDKAAELSFLPGHVLFLVVQLEKRFYMLSLTVCLVTNNIAISPLGLMPLR